MTILSIDVGIRNLALCLLDDSTNTVIEWDVDGIPPEHKDGIFPCLRDHLDARAWVIDADTILIEKQPPRNKRMVMVMHFLHSYFVIRSPRSETIIYDAKHKVPDVVGTGRAQYVKRKKTAVERCRQFIVDTDAQNGRWLSVFDKTKKKDDMADTVLQALSFTKRVAPLPVTKAKTKQVVARKPTEQQRETKYSKSNLAYILKNAPECECLENNKRFMKDLRRYYKSIDELKADMGAS